MERFDAMLKYVLQTAKKQNIPVSDDILPEVGINYRATGRFGACRKTVHGFETELTYKLMDADDKACLTVLAHEVLHTCPGCMNHGKRWKSYAARLSRALDVNIKYSSSYEELGIDDTRCGKYKYTVVCGKCGAIIKRQKASKLIMHPEKYRCRCGGTFYVTSVKE